MICTASAGKPASAAPLTRGPFAKEEMKTTGQCLLCHETRELRRSHIIPKFVSDWQKASSATGYIRNAKAINVRFQTIDLCLRKYLWINYLRKHYPDFQNQRIRTSCCCLTYDRTRMKVYIRLSRG